MSPSQEVIKVESIEEKIKFISAMLERLKGIHDQEVQRGLMTQERREESPENA